ncbi:pancreatic alpha-amylase-like [Onychostruthus taczanowskii]|uniref:pancreatic alpha-amylase-like n=1 Tax=Onychostruthus taczanowskii TaxID=356909 RepID=UPI001B803866|nr:pancreatic alpha-amylase-like [Onychostruthus taczanowskii]
MGYYRGQGELRGGSTTASSTAHQIEDRSVRDCRLSSLLDLALEKDYVRSEIAEYMNRLIDIGVAGFRIDAAKHMWPGDIRAFLDKLHDLNTQWFSAGTKPFIYQEVIDLGSEPIKGSEYFGNGRVTEFKYGAKLGTVLRKWDGEKMAYLKNWGEGWGFVPSDRALVFVDNHDNQRGHGAGGASILTFWDARLYKMAVGFMLAHPAYIGAEVKEPSNETSACKESNSSHVPVRTQSQCVITGCATPAAKGRARAGERLTLGTLSATLLRAGNSYTPAASLRKAPGMAQQLQWKSLPFPALRYSCAAWKVRSVPPPALGNLI